MRVRAAVVCGLLASTLPCVLNPSAVVAQTPSEPQFADLCTPTDAGLAEVSGLTAIDGVTYAIGDSGTDDRLAVLDGSCAVSRWLDVPVDPYDVEDLSSHDGRLWLSDTGDNDRQRSTVALTRMDPVSGSGELYRLTYPDGPHDAETLLIEPGGRPIIVTKEAQGVSGVYVPAGDRTVSDLPSPGPTPLVKSGEIAFEPTTTPGGPPIIVGSLLATGGAVSADGSVAAVRTYTDVYLFAVDDGDVVTALTGKPVVVPVADQPQGEAVAFDSAGDLLVASEAAGGALPPVRSLSDATSLITQANRDKLLGPGADAATDADTEASTRGWWTLGAVAAVGVFLLGSIVLGVRSARKTKSKRRP